MPKTGFHARCPFIQGRFVCIKEDKSCVFTVDEQLGGAKKKIFNWVSQFIHSCSQGTSDNDCI